MSTNSHMTAGINLGFDRWVLFDNLKSSYEDFNPLQADFKEEFTIHIAGYVYKTESDHHGDGMLFIILHCLNLSNVHALSYFRIFILYFNADFYILFNSAKRN